MRFVISKLTTIMKVRRTNYLEISGEKRKCRGQERMSEDRYK
jgi:hypothetical protein